MRILAGRADGREAAAMYDSVTGWMLGPIFEAPDAEDQVEGFLAWLSGGGWREYPDLSPRPGTFYLRGDARCWPDGVLGELVARWRADHVGEDGQLLDPLWCACGHGVDDHGERVDDARVAYARPCDLCACEDWTPGNRAAELRTTRREES